MFLLSRQRAQGLRIPILRLGVVTSGFVCFSKRVSAEGSHWLQGGRRVQDWVSVLGSIFFGRWLRVHASGMSTWRHHN